MCIALSVANGCRGKVPANGTGAMTSGIVPGLMSHARFEESEGIVHLPNPSMSALLVTIMAHILVEDYCPELCRHVAKSVP